MCDELIRCKIVGASKMGIEELINRLTEELGFKFNVDEVKRELDRGCIIIKGEEVILKIEKL